MINRKQVRVQCKSLLRFICLAAMTVWTLPAAAEAWWDGEWSYRTRITLNTTAAGANIHTEAGRTPILIRLHSGNFNFADAKSDGSDLRFIASDDRTPLKFHIERYSAAAEQALVWVDAPDLKANASDTIFVYYGAKKANAGANEAGTYASSYALVYHFNEAGAPRDSTANATHALTSLPRNTNGLIGNSAVFDGLSSVRIPDATSLALAADQKLSIILWIKPAVDGVNSVLYSAPGGVMMGLQNGMPFVNVDKARVLATQAVTPDSWSHIAMVADGTRIALYVNGVRVNEMLAKLPTTRGESLLGGPQPELKNVMQYHGEIDEFVIIKAALSDGAMAAINASQGLNARLVMVDHTAEENASGHNYISVLFNALTPDAWAVIVLLGIMSLLSWVVMVSKSLYVSGVDRNNEAFIARYRAASASRKLHEGLPELRIQKNEGGLSVLSHLYEIGRSELAMRLEEYAGSGNGAHHALAPQSVAAIRSALDAGVIREGQKLNRNLVLLTIAIAGGPFLGLLGTVIGVMLTFASVAAAGDVNINAIAPGIAAALLATVAGLAVAIPALFGYNYVLSRIEHVTADMGIFVDELEKRIAEVYRGSNRARLMEVAS